MSRTAYPRDLPLTDVITDQHRRLARAHLDLAAELYRCRLQRGHDPATLADRAGLSVERLDLIEEGDTTLLTEILRLCQALDATLVIDGRLRVALRAADGAIGLDPVAAIR